MPCTTHPRFRKSLLAMAASAALAPYGAWALTLAQEPPLPKIIPSFVAPNVIISLDDSGSMGFCLDKIENDPAGCTEDGNGWLLVGAHNRETPETSGKPWPANTRRMNVLKHALKEVFQDTKLLPDKRIRLGWQAMHNNGNALTNYQDTSFWYKTGTNPGKGKTPGANNVGTTSTGAKNSIRPLDATHRANFIQFVDYMLPKDGTPSHLMFKQADEYLRDTALDTNSPWAAVPGTTDKPFLGCRRNYHIMMSDGRWNGKVSGGDQDGINWATSGGRLAYSTSSDQTRIYRDTDPDNLADWAFKSWMDPLKSTGLEHADKIKRSKTYEDAPPTELFSVARNVSKIVTAPGTNSTQRRNACLAIPGEWLGGTTDNCRVTNTETKSVNLQSYWNPKYNPATWPHMVTYTIGFSEEAVTWEGATNIISPTDQAPFGYDKGFADIVTGWETWPTMTKDTENKNSLDMWHAAINGRGRFYAVRQGADLKKAFEDILGKIIEESSTLPDTVGVGGAASGFNTTRNNAGNFSSAYNGKEGWKGWVSASPAREPITGPCPADPSKTCDFYPDPTKGWNGKTTADRLDDLTNLNTRLVLSWSDEWASTNNYKGGVPFKWATDQTYLSSAQKAWLGKETSDTTATVYTKGENVLNYIRGDRTLEGDKDTTDGYTAAKPFRERASSQGDIINSEIWYTGAPASNYTLAGYNLFVSTYKSRTPMLYVGGNDGMLHGFSATDGNEKIAYVPRGVLIDLKKLADPKYNHQYFVDGSPMAGDIKDGTDWRTMLVGSLGAGGKGYFVLDVTDPSTFAEKNSHQLVVKDRTRGNGESAPDCNRTGISAAEKTACLSVVEEDKDIGNITAQPVRDSANPLRSTQIVRLNNNRWAAVMGNGYNSANQRPVLLVQYLDGTKELMRIQASDDDKEKGNAADNGLAAPTLVDLNGDSRVDIVYAGDNLGNLWKFDLTSELSSEWKVAPGIDKPLFTARGPSVKGAITRDKAQPITAPPIVRANDRTKCSEVDGNGKCKTTAVTQAVGGMMVSFGTGRNLTLQDRNIKAAEYKYVQTLYSVLDNARYQIKDKTIPKDDQRLKIHAGDPPKIPAPKQVGTMGEDAKLAQQVIYTLSAGNDSVKPADPANELTNATWGVFDGWYLDLPEEGERLLKSMQFWDGSNILAVYSEAPSATESGNTTNTKESCEDVTQGAVPGTQYRSLINIMDGKKPSVQLVGGSVAVGTTRIEVPMGTPTLVTSGKKILDYTGVRPGAGGGGDKPRVDNRMPEQSLRPSWRQVK